MSQDETKKVNANRVTTGLAIGLAAGYLLSDEKRRKKIKQKLDSAVKWATSKDASLKDKADEVVKDVKTKVSDKMTDVEDEVSDKVKQISKK